MTIEYVHGQINVRAYKSQLDNGRLANADDNLRMSLLGQMWVADWKYFMVAAGRAFRMSIGTFSGGDAVTLVGNGTTVNLDQPQGLISVPLGWRLIPMEVELDCVSDVDAYDDVVQVGFLADRSQAYASATATAETPDNLLDGGRAFPGFACSIVSGDITDPVPSDVLLWRNWELTQVASETAGNGIPSFAVQKEWTYPTLLAGPCALLLYVGGTNATTFAGSVTFGCVPEEWFPTQ